MSSQKKIDANRANARKSTGPRTAAGKAASRANAYRHGMRARSVIMPHEDQDQYHKLYNSYCQEFPCTTPHEQFLVKQLTDAFWRLERLKGIETTLLDQDEVDPVELERIARWQTRMENSYYKAHKELEALKKAYKQAREAGREDTDQPQGEVCLWMFNPETGERTQLSGPPMEYDPSTELSPDFRKPK
jgi:hypothetical protein